MQLFKSDIRILEALKTVQESETCYAIVDFEQKRAYHTTSYYHDAVERAISTNNYVVIRSGEENIAASLLYLAKHGFVVHIGGPVYQVTHKGWFSKELRRRKIVHSLINHVLFPSLVALITTLLTLLISLQS